VANDSGALRPRQQKNTPVQYSSRKISMYNGENELLNAPLIVFNTKLIDYRLQKSAQKTRRPVPMAQQVYQINLIKLFRCKIF
jgi:hypothetical protein